MVGSVRASFGFAELQWQERQKKVGIYMLH
jgi:hypothetical protein